MKTNKVKLWTANKINALFEIFFSSNPTPKVELEYKNHFTLLVAVVLSAQSTDVGVNKATKSLFINYDTPEKFLSLGEIGLKNYIKTIGLYNAKAKNIIAFSKILVEQYNSRIPNSFEELVKLPGVGRKSANLVLNVAFGVPTIPVDTHVFRVSNRLGLSKSTTPEKVEQDLMNAVPQKWIKIGAHHWLVLHGRYTCKAIKPKCEICPVEKLCHKIGIKNI